MLSKDTILRRTQAEQQKCLKTHGRIRAVNQPLSYTVLTLELEEFNAKAPRQQTFKVDTIFWEIPPVIPTV